MFIVESCSIEGQTYTIDCFGINATCSNPNPPMKCDFPQCVCPRGQVIDEATNTCIDGTQCRKCNHVFYNYSMLLEFLHDR